MGAFSNKSAALLLIYINIALYALCYQAQSPLEPFRVEKIIEKEGKGSAESYASLQSFFGVMQLVGSLVSGPMLDRFGAKGGFMVNFLCCTASYYLLSESTTMTGLYLSKIPSLFQAGFLCAQLSVVQITQEGEERAAALGFLSTSYLVGMTIGPSLGGFLGAAGDYQFCAKLAMAGSLLSFVLVMFIPLNEAKREYEEAKAKKQEGKAKTEAAAAATAAATTTTAATAAPAQGPRGVDSSSSSSSSTTAVGRLLSGLKGLLGPVWLLLATKLLSGSANAIQSSVGPLILKNTFHFNEIQLGLSMSVSAVINMFLGTFLGKIVAWSGGGITLIGYCLSLSTAIYVCQTTANLPAMATAFPVLANSSIQSLALYMTTTILLSLPQFILASTITSESSSRVQEDRKGTLLGLEHGLFALVRIPAPSIGQKLLASGGISRVSAMCTCIYFMVLALWTKKKHSITTTISSGAVLIKGVGVGAGVKAGVMPDASLPPRDSSTAATATPAQEKTGGSDGHRKSSSSSGGGVDSPEKKHM